MRAKRVQRTLRRSWALGLLATSACLVTDEVRFQRPSNLTEVVAESPRPFAHFPFGGDPECRESKPDSMMFSVRLQDRDVEAELWGFWLVNGVALGIETQFPPGAPSYSVERSSRECLPKRDLSNACNFVQLVITTGFVPDERRALLADSFGVARTAWFVIGPSDAQPEASEADCMALFADAGGDAGADAGTDASGGGAAQ